MKRLFGLVLLAAVAFYVAWPAYSGYQIKTALDDRDADGLRSRVDFETVRGSMRPAITAKVETTLDNAAEKAGPAGAKIYTALKSQVMPKIVEAALARAVTPEMLIRMHEERGTIKDIMNRIIGEQVAKSGGAIGGTDGTGKAGGLDAGSLIGGLLGKKPDDPAPAAPVANDSKGKSSLTWRNVKGFGFDGPLGVYVQVAKIAASTEPDLTAHMSFRNGGWVLTGLEPRL